MNILDEDIDLYQRQSLEAKKIHVRQIGVEIGRMWPEKRSAITFAAFCAILHFAPKRNEWAKSCACATAG